jgi:hypothetical protein
VDVKVEGEPARAKVGYVATLDAFGGTVGATRTASPPSASSAASRTRLLAPRTPPRSSGPQPRPQPAIAGASVAVGDGPPPVPASLIPAAAGWSHTLYASMTIAHVISPEVAGVLERGAVDVATLIPDRGALAEQARRPGLANMTPELIVREHPTRALVELSRRLAPPVLLMAQEAEDIEGQNCYDGVGFKVGSLCSNEV